MTSVRVRDRWATARIQYGAVAALSILGLVVSTTAMAPDAGATASHPHPALCTASAVRVTATTNRPRFLPGQVVMMKSSITNVSTTACSVWLGLDPGFSPAFIVLNADRKEVWDRCWDDDKPGACFEILYQRGLHPGQTYHTIARWDQGSSTGSQPPQRVPPGRYTFLTYFGYINHVARAHITIRPAPASAKAG
jgi:hypothetical protein